MKKQDSPTYKFIPVLDDTHQKFKERAVKEQKTFDQLLNELLK